MLCDQLIENYFLFSVGCCSPQTSDDAFDRLLVSVESQLSSKYLKQSVLYSTCPAVSF